MTYLIHPQTAIGRVHLKVSHMERSLKFYHEVIGFEVLKQEGNTAELTADGTNSLVVLEEIADAVIKHRGNTTGLYHFAILVPSRRDLSLSLRNLLLHEMRIGQADHLVSEALYISDPDSNGIEIYVDRPRETWKLDAQGRIMMASDPIAWQSLLDEAGEDKWNGLSPGTTIGHMHLHVADLKKAEQFYCQMLGFEIKAHIAESALFVSAGGYHHHIGLNIWAGVGAPPPPPNAVGLRYFTIVVPNHVELETLLAHLRNSGIPVEPQDEGWLVQDPSRNAILLVEQDATKLI